MKYYLTTDGKKTEIRYNTDTYLLDKGKRHLVKIIANEGYMITKCGSIEWLCKELNKTMSDLVDKSTGVYTDNLYYDLLKYVIKHDINKLYFEPIYSTANGYQLLKQELHFLEENFGKKGCLNNRNIPYIPKTVHANKGSNWLKKNEYLNIMKLLKQYEY